MSVDVHLFASGVPARMGAAAFTLASTVESATGGWNHRITAVYGTEAVPAPPAIATSYPVPPGGVPLGLSSLHDDGVLYPTWSTVGPALPIARCVRPVGGGYQKPPYGGFVASGTNAPQDAVVKPAILVRQGARQGRITTAPKAQMVWVRQGG